MGLLRLRSFRPFPVEDLKAALGNAKAVAVLDRDCSFGYEGALATEVKAALAELSVRPQVAGFIGGLGGRDLTPAELAGIFRHCLEGVRRLDRGEAIIIDGGWQK